MFEILDRKQLSDGIFFTRITDGRFKTNRISITFYTDFSKGTRADYSILPYILTDSCRKYPDLTRLTEKYSDLYGASLSDRLSCEFDSRSMTFSISFIDDRYTLYGEKLEQECCSLLLDCLLDPVLENGAFPAAQLEIMRMELIDAIRSVKGDKRLYAAQEGSRAAYRGEPCSVPVNGTAGEAQAVTPQSAFAAYRDMLENAHIEIFAAGCSDFAQSETMLAERLGSLARNASAVPAAKPSPLKEDVFRIGESMKMQQAILRMYFKAPQMDDRFAGVLLNQILGGMTTSRFFSNIREKQSLCYYCASGSSRFKRSIIVYAGVDPANIARTEHAVMSEFMNISMMGVTAEELEHAKLDAIESVRGIYDSASAVSSWYSAQITDPEFMSPEQFIENIRNVDADRVMKACRQYCLDTVYTLSPEEVK